MNSSAPGPASDEVAHVLFLAAETDADTTWLDHCVSAPSGKPDAAEGKTSKRQTASPPEPFCRNGRQGQNLR